MHVCHDHMDENINDRINILRKRSRLLLAQADRDSKKVKKEIKKLYSQDVTLREYYKNDIDDQNFFYKRHAESWNLRNDSSSVGAALCPDYFCNSLNRNPASMPNISTAKRVLVSSKKKHCDDRCFPKSIHRKPVKECYCNPEIKKLQLRSGRTQYKQALPCKHCKSHAYFNPPIAKDSGGKSPLSSSISCETLRQVQNINYAPRSQFLRNVQSKVSLLHATGDSPEVYPRCPCYHELMARKTIPNVDSKGQSRADKESEINDHLTKSKSFAKLAKNVESNEKDQYSGSDSINKSNKGACQVCLKKQARSKNVCKRTTSKKAAADVKKTKSSSKTSAKSKRALQSLQKKCTCCPDNKTDNASKTTLGKGSVDAEDYQHTVCVNTRLEDIDGEYLSDEDVRELGNFREQNYFDTHGSSHTLQSSKCSGSVEQYLLNDRLFPEPARRTHKTDLVVTMPACATIQRKRVHYFPRYIVRQEKSSCNTSYKKKHCQSCPLTGHAIDLGITKIRSPLNSLALKYQKRQP